MKADGQQFSSNLFNPRGALTRPDLMQSVDPRDHWVISKTVKGEPCSRFIDDTWDFSAYYPPATKSLFTEIKFYKINKKHIPLAKMFLLSIIYKSTPNRTNKPVYPSTLYVYFNCLHTISAYADSIGMSLYEVLNDKILFTALIRHIEVAWLLKTLRAILGHVHKADFGFKVIECGELWQMRLINQKLKKLPKSQQYPVIPERIFSNLITELITLFDEYFKYSVKFRKFFAKCNANPEDVKGKDKTVSVLQLNFLRTAAKYGLSEYFSSNRINDLNKFGAHITKLQHAARTLISIYTGMRYSEVRSLERGCLVVSKKSHFVFIKGFSNKSKLHDDRETWVSSREIVAPVREMQKLSDLIYSKNHDSTKRLLFPSTNHCTFKPRNIGKKAEVKIGTSHCYKDSVYKILNTDKFQITNTDMLFLDTISPFRDWASEDKFKIGKIWKFSDHQFRRSLAYYVAQSGLVSLTTMRNQYKHVSSNMTLYYGQSFGAPNKGSAYFNDFHQYLFEIKPEADAAAYIRNVIFSDDKLYGVAGKIENKTKHKVKNNVVLFKGRKELEKKFYDGDIAYSEIPLGACVSTEVCIKKPVLSISGCLNCKSAIIKKEAVNIGIQSLELHLSECKTNDTDNFIYRVDRNDLEALKKFKSIILKDTENEP